MVQLDNNEHTISFYLELLSDMPCWAVVAGEGTGSMVSLSFGKKFLREYPSKNENLTHDSATYDAELELFIQFADWQILDVNQNNLVVCNCDSCNNNDGEMVSGLNQLINKKVVSTMLDFNGKDFELNFEGGLKLCVICQVDIIPDCIDYDFYYRC